VLALTKLRSPSTQTGVGVIFLTLPVLSGLIELTLFSPCFCIVCILIWILNFNSLIAFGPNEQRAFRGGPDPLPFSFSMGYAMLHAGFCLPIDIMSILPLVFLLLPPDLHTCSHYLYELALRGPHT
jgi:hypothetical protein